MDYLQTVADTDPVNLSTTADHVWRYLILIGAGIITALGLIILWFIRQALNGRLLGLLAPFVAPLIRMVYESTIMQRLYSKRLPKMTMPRTWVQFMDMPPEFKFRLEVYNDTMIMTKELLYGPYAMCQLVARLFQEGFNQQLIRRKRDFQQYAAMVREFTAELERFEDNLRQRTAKLTEQIRTMENRVEEYRLVLSSWKRWQRLYARFLSCFWLAYFFSTPKEIREARLQLKQTRKTLQGLLKKRHGIAGALFRNEHRQLIRVGTRLVHYDNSHMSNLMHILGCAMEDIQATIHSGLLMEMLAADSPQSRKVRQALGLGPGELPFGFTAMRSVTKATAKNEAGSKGQMPREDELEIFLRSRLRNHPRWGHFARYAAPDGSVGLSATKFGYIPELRAVMLRRPVAH